jgi:hypothetical protein
MGVYDLAMIGNGKLDIQNKLWQQSGEQKIDFDESSLSSNGVLVIDELGQYYQIQQLIGHNEDDFLGYGVIKGIDGEIRVLLPDDPENYEPRQYLPYERLEFVVRETEINKFESTSSQINSQNLTITSTDNLEQPNQTQPRKKLKPIERETENLLLIYGMTKHYQVQYLSDLDGTRAWNEIVSCNFISDLIDTVAVNKKSITFKSGKKLTRSNFIEIYRSRFVDMQEKI